MRPGDRIEVTVEGVGTLINGVEAEVDCVDGKLGDGRRG
jgi:fumarylacetoacetate (FAA) hydrolase family protein